MSFFVSIKSNKMNTYCIIFILAVAFLSGIEGMSEAERAMADSLHKKCYPISGATEAMINQAREGNFSEDPAFKEHLYCMCKGYGIFKESGEVNIDVVQAILQQKFQDPALRDEVKAKCLVMKETPQETSLQSIKCLYDFKENIL
ncbi:B2 protein-like [Diabrotica virgifera virgifera]|uniref:B2 protein-like n=1 Tax=Diabrotica virgifera virgifera TaxID=50390 RepID=A0A6P7FBQ6_DIAVI|nr:B2 protein-like [Diabrotica virgifera virgifera]